jgi:hypothetical protein
LAATYLWIGFNQSAISCTPVKMRIGEHTRKLAKLFKIYSNLSFLNKKISEFALSRQTTSLSDEPQMLQRGRPSFQEHIPPKGFQI